MGLFCTVAVAAVIYFIIKRVYSKLTNVPPTPVLKNTWWGPGVPRQVDESIRPFKIEFSKQVVDDLKQRLKRAPDFTPPLEGIGFEYGFNSEYLKEVVEYWHDKYNWQEREAFLNSLPQFKTYVDGLDLHFIHVKPKDVPSSTRVLPLLLLHGWPGSVREFYEIIPLLTTPRAGVNFVFEVVAPSLPGYGFSEGAAKTGLGPAQMGIVVKNLMKKLGFEKFYVQGGDWGSIIATSMGTFCKNNLLGLHVNMCSSGRTLSRVKWLLGSLWPTLLVEEKYVHKMYPIKKWFANLMKEFGYMHIQATKPDTVATALRDSPAGLAAYILEKFSTWTNPEWESRTDGGLTVKYKLDDLLDNIMIYWVSGSITTSVRLYSEAFSNAYRSLGIDSIPVEVPTACALFPNELVYQPEYILKDKYRNIVQCNHLPRGGHFAAFEEPLLLADDVWSAVRRMQARVS